MSYNVMKTVELIFPPFNKIHLLNLADSCFGDLLILLKTGTEKNWYKFV